MCLSRYVGICCPSTPPYTPVESKSRHGSRKRILGIRLEPDRVPSNPKLRRLTLVTARGMLYWLGIQPHVSSF